MRRSAAKAPPHERGRIGVTNWTAWWIAVRLLLAELFGGMHALGLTGVHNGEAVA